MQNVSQSALGYLKTIRRNLLFVKTHFNGFSSNEIKDKSRADKHTNVVS